MAHPLFDVNKLAICDRPQHRHAQLWAAASGGLVMIAGVPPPPPTPPKQTRSPHHLGIHPFACWRHLQALVSSVVALFCHSMAATP